MGPWRVVALGGCGGMGRFAVKTLLDFDCVDQVIIADKNIERAEAFARSCGQKAKARRIDIRDSEELTGLLSEAEAVLTTVGPYFRYGRPILEAAIRARCHYIDINDDWEPTLEMLGLHREAEAAGITALIGMGASPGLSNLLAVKAMAGLDRVDDLMTGWGAGESDDDDFGEPGQGGTFGAATEHWVHQFSGTIRVRRNGEFIDAAPLETLTIDYPGIGRGAVYTLGHPEPVTLPLFRPEIQNSYNVMDFPPYLISILKGVAAQVDSGGLTVTQAADWINNLPGLGFRGLVFSRYGPGVIWALVRQMFKSQPAFPSEFAVASGERDGRRGTVGARLTAAPFGGLDRMTMGAITGVPMAVALKMLAEGRISRRGVFAPEVVVPVDDFFEELGPLCTPACQGAGDLVAITTSLG